MFARAHLTRVPRNGSRLLRTLVIEDDDALRRVILEALTARGHAAVGLSRFDLSATPDLPPAEVWIVDHTLPGQLGPDLVRRLRSPSSRSRHALIIGVSADPRVEASFLAAGADRFLRKPFTLGALADAIDAGTAAPAFSGT